MRHTDVRDCFVRVRARAAFEAPGRVALKACMINQCTTRSVTEKKKPGTSAGTSSTSSGNSTRTSTETNTTTQLHSGARSPDEVLQNPGPAD